MTRFPPLVSRLIPSLGRDNDNEVLATVHAIDAALRGAKLDWFDLAQACTAPALSAATTPYNGSSTPQRPPLAFGDMTRACRDLDRGRLSDHERIFVRQMLALGFNRQPTASQRAWLTAIFYRLRLRTAA